MEELTKRQRAILEYIRDSIISDGRSPTVREIGARFKISSTNGVRDHIKALIHKGFVIKDELVSRGLRLVESVGTKVTSMPIVGVAPAGNLITAIENFEGQVAVDESFLPSKGCFSLRIQGDSMHDAGIHDGDLVMVKKQSQVEKGDIIVAVIEDEATVKRIFYNAGSYKGKFMRGMIRLQPENSHYKPIIVDPRREKFYIAGKVVGLMRRIY